MSESSENDIPVRVAVRQRPFQGKDNSQLIIKYEPKSSNIILVDDRPYLFDQVFGPKITQKQLFEAEIKPLVEKVINGFNCTALAYGQTGTGKSYTMGLSGAEIDEKHTGIVRRCMSQIMESNSARYHISVSFVEIYNEKVFDLLSDNPTEPIMSKGFKYTGGTRKQVLNMADCNEILKKGVSKRHVRPTTMNAQSSRSHVIFSIEVTSTDLTKPTRAYLNLVDLAGSEGVRRTGHTGQAMSEGVHINQGLLCIGKILQAMSEGKKVLPFRDSVLGVVMQDSLNLNSYLTLLACISAERLDLSETLSTIRFAQRAKQLKLTPQMNSLMAELNKYKTKTPFNAKATTLVRPMPTPFKRSATESQISNTFCTPAKERRTENQLNRTDIGLTPKEREKTQKQLQSVPINSFAFPAPIARSSTNSVHPTAQRESLFEQTIESWALNASTSTVAAFEAPSCIEKPISYSPIVEKCMEKMGSVIENKMLKVMESFFHGNSQTQMPLKTPTAHTMEHFQQNTTVESILNELVTERNTESLRRIEVCSSPPKTSAKCQLFNTSSPNVFKVPEIPPKPASEISVHNIANNSIDHSMINNTVHPARRSTRLKSQHLENSEVAVVDSNPHRKVRRSARLQEQLPSFDDSLVQRNSERIEANNSMRRSTRRRSRSVPIHAEQIQISNTESKTKMSKKKKSSANSIYTSLLATCASTSGNTNAKSKLAKLRKEFLELLNQCSMKELQKLPQVGLKTAYQLVTHRTLNGKFKNLAQVEALPMWRGKSWERFAQANMLVELSAQ